MGGVMQNPKEKPDKSNPGGGWSVSAIIWAVLAAAAVMGIFGFVPLWFPEEWGWGKDEMSILERMKFAAYVVGGGLVLWQLQISNRRSTALEKTAALGEKGNITERFKNAIEHLGSDSESIRMGGIYGLYHVVRESRGYADTVLKILCAHAKSIMAKPEYAKQEKPSNEITAILDVLFPIDYKNGKPDDVLFVKVDISNWHLRGADVNFRNMQRITGEGVNLSLARLHGAHLMETALLEANLMMADLSEANLMMADLSSANLSEADLAAANLSAANLMLADLSAADLSNANLLAADLAAANLSEANLSAADLSEANLSEANLSAAHLLHANLSRARVTAEQLLQVKTLYEAQFDDQIREEIMRRKPELLEYSDVPVPF